MGYRPVARPSQVRVGDEAGPQRVGRVGERVDAGPFDGSLYEVVHAVPAEPAGYGPVAWGVTTRPPAARARTYAGSRYRQGQAPNAPPRTVHGPYKSAGVSAQPLSCRR